MANDAAPVRTELLGEHESESLRPNVRPCGGVDCFGPAMGDALPSYTHTYRGRATDVLMHPSFFDDGEGNF